MNVTVIYNQGSLYETNREQKIADKDTYLSAVQIKNALEKSGYKTEITEIRPGQILKIKQISSDLIFNLCEWTGKDYYLGIEIIKILSTMNIPFTGGDERCSLWSSDKVLMKKLMSENNIPTPKWHVFVKTIDSKSVKVLEKFKYPLIVKPAWEHCGIGIHQNSIVKSTKNLINNVNKLIDAYRQPVLAEEYIEGRELQITVLRNGKFKVLPPAEIIFENRRGMKKIFSFESKWENDSDQSIFLKTVLAKLDKRTERNIKLISRRIFEKMGCAGYIRIDARIRSGKIYVLEVNVNPGIDADPEYGMTVSCEAVGWSFDRLVREIVKAALHRYEVINGPGFSQSPMKLNVI